MIFEVVDLAGACLYQCGKMYPCRGPKVDISNLCEQGILTAIRFSFQRNGDVMHKSITLDNRAASIETIIQEHLFVNHFL